MFLAATIPRNDSSVSEGCAASAQSPRAFHHLVQLTCTLLTLLVDAALFLWLCLHAPTALAAEHVLRKQLALLSGGPDQAQRSTDTTHRPLVSLGAGALGVGSSPSDRLKTLPVPLQAHRHQLAERVSPWCHSRFSVA